MILITAWRKKLNGNFGGVLQKPQTTHEDQQMTEPVTKYLTQIFQ